MGFGFPGAGLDLRDAFPPAEFLEKLICQLFTTDRQQDPLAARPPLCPEEDAWKHETEQNSHYLALNIYRNQKRPRHRIAYQERKEEAMSTSLLAVMVALASLAYGILPGEAQERTPEEVRRLLERRTIPPQAQFVPGEVIAKMKPARTLRPADLNRFGVEDGKRVTSGGELLYRIPPTALKTLSPTQARDRTLEVIRQLH